MTENNRLTIDSAIENLFIGGNHLAAWLINRSVYPSEFTEADQVGKRHGIEAMDIWVAWKAIMDFSKVHSRSEYPDTAKE